MRSSIAIPSLSAQLRALHKVEVARRRKRLSTMRRVGATPDTGGHYSYRQIFMTSAGW